MKLWLLERHHVPGSPSYDVLNGVVVRAQDEAAARRLAAQHPGDESRQAWLTVDGSTCEQLTADGAEEIVLRDFNAG